LVTKLRFDRQRAAQSVEGSVRYGRLEWDAMTFRMLVGLALLLGFWSTGRIALAQTGVGSESQSVVSTTPSEKKTDPAQPRQTRVVFIIADGCQECDRVLSRLRRPGGDFETMTAAGWKIGSGPENHIQIVDQLHVTSLTEKLSVKSFPTVACISGDEIIRAFSSGCSTPLDAWTLNWLIKGKDERPTPLQPEPIRVATTGNYPLRGNHWSIDGVWNPSKELLVHHLRGPVHATQIAATWKIESWEHEELRSLHDDLHEREMGGVVSAMQSPLQQHPSTSFTNARKMYGKF
jgi:hypothetical protein